MSGNTIASLPLRELLQPDVALALQQMLGIHTVGGFLNAWRDKTARRFIEHVFESPQQARAAAATYAAWLGGAAVASTQLPTAMRCFAGEHDGQSGAIGL